MLPAFNSNRHCYHQQINIYCPSFLVPAHLSSPRQRAIKRVCVCVCVSLLQCWGDGVVFCLEQGADCLHMVQLMPLPSQNPSPLASYKSRLFIPSWYWLTQIFLEKRLLNGCSSVLPTSVLTLLAGYESPEITADCNSLIPCAIQTHLLH